MTETCCTTASQSVSESASQGVSQSGRESVSPSIRQGMRERRVFCPVTLPP